MRFFYLVLIGALCLTCSRRTTDDKLFRLVSPGTSGVNFSNNLHFDQAFNIYTYRNFYNGGGVALGDINNDGLIDIFFTANQERNRLYLNKGNFKFEDISELAGIGGSKAWSTGVSMVDINGDGWLDIYVCNSGDVKGDNKENELFINNGNLTFTERASHYGIADSGFSTHAVFFDYDNDSDLDLYILNNSYQAIGSFNLMKNVRNERDLLGGDKLYRNDNGKFKDVSKEAGIFGSVIGFGLGVTVGDINGDGWLDIYVSNDFFERDYLYINLKDGTFKECLTSQIESISGASMGADLADINNDGLPDIFVTEMLPNDYGRLKSVTTFENWDRYQYSVQNGYHHQFTRNMLQLNNGNNSFSEIGRLANVAATDWSWGALIFDMDNDGYKDIFVSNGIYQDLTDQDYLQYVSSEEVVRSVVSNKNVNYKKLVELIPSNPIPNFSFKNLKNLQFENVAGAWGLDALGFSNGAAYGDLDNDGDMDLVINNVNATALVYENQATRLYPDNKYLKFVLEGPLYNNFAIGTAIRVYAAGELFYIENVPNRGFQSSVDGRLNLGLGALNKVDSIVVSWPKGKQTKLYEIETNKTLVLNFSDAREYKAVAHQKNQMFQPIPSFIEAEHIESQFVDFDRDKLIFHMLSTPGPKLTVGDVNGDYLDDIYLGGAKGQTGTLLLQNKNKGFTRLTVAAFEGDKMSEDVACIFFDADGDSDLDLYVASGSNEFSTSSIDLADRLYFNDGRGNFTKSTQILPKGDFENTSVVVAADFDKDGDLDLFVGIRSHPFFYGKPTNGYILQNDGNGFFSDITDHVAGGLKSIGMITDAVWADINGDSWVDLIVVGEYMPVKVFLNQGGTFTDDTERYGLENFKGWWSKVIAADVDNDGDLDIVLGNHGLNSRFKSNGSYPIELFVNDFDGNGSIEQILCMYFNDESYPLVLRHDLVSQIPSLKKKYLRYQDFKTQNMLQIFGAKGIESSIQLMATELRSGLLLNHGGSFEFRPLPIEAQFSPIFAIVSNDFDNDGFVDLIIGGNLYNVKPEAGRYDASEGLFLRGKGDGTFAPVLPRISGLKLVGEVRDLKILHIQSKVILLAARNNDSLMSWLVQ
ncbi:MAG: VCBS repeat-containing protein [Cytophagales bacterium]|nr:VCBS repeat-containing protein [Cytophagales bacterium]